ncbi:MAG: MBL fold metallo-hydrolase [Candidatus Eisenbacteria bacterium]
MSLTLCSFASGSSGNAHLIGSGGSYVLIDCGISSLRIRRALGRVGVSPGAIEGILLTHEHRDHTAGLEVFRKGCPVPIYGTAATGETLPFRAGRDHVRPVEPGRPFAVGPFRITPFRVCHDAADPVGFRIGAEEGDAAFATDLGTVDDGVREAIGGVRVLVLESNHDEELLINGPYPWYLKERIRSRHGHLSNGDSRSALASARHDGLEAVVLAHLSAENNRPGLAMDTAREALRENGNRTKIILAEQHRETEVLEFR